MVLALCFLLSACKKTVKPLSEAEKSLVGIWYVNGQTDRTVLCNNRKLFVVAPMPYQKTTSCVVPFKMAQWSIKGTALQTTDVEQCLISAITKADSCPLKGSEYQLRCEKQDLPLKINDLQTTHQQEKFVKKISHCDLEDFPKNAGDIGSLYQALPKINH